MPGMDQGMQQQAQGSGGDLKSLVVKGHDGLVELLDGLQSSGAPEAMLKRLAMVLQEYRAFVAEDLGQGGGEQQRQAPQSDGTVPPEAGAQAVRPV